MKKRPALRILSALLCCLFLMTPLLASAEQTDPQPLEDSAEPEEAPEEEEKNTGYRSSMTKFERRLVETGMRLMPYDHPFVLAYEKAHGIDIKNYVAEVKGVTVSGVPFDFGGNGEITGFRDDWWQGTGVARYPVRGLDCAEYIHWIYRQLGYTVPDSSTGLFFGGVEGVTRNIRGIREHKVIPSFSEAMIGDIAYNSENQSYRSGHGSHVQMFIGTARQLGMAKEIREYWPDFPVDAYLVLDCGWADGEYYYDIMKKLRVRNARSSLAGVGVQFFTSIRSGDQVLYACPSKEYKWTNPETGNTFRINSRLEAQRRYLQYRRNSKIEYIMNLSRPLHRPDC